jgi:hypothetical protein
MFPTTSPKTDSENTVRPVTGHDDHRPQPKGGLDGGR